MSYHQVQLTSEVLESLAARMGEGNLSERMRKQASHVACFEYQARGIMKLERHMHLYKNVGRTLKMMGLWEAGHRAFLDIQLRENEVVLPGLPPAFDGYQILQMSDLHIDIDPELPGAIIKAIQGVDCDIVVSTGDYRNRTLYDHRKAMRMMSEVCAVIDKPHYAILGNHDFVEEAPELETMGMQLLLNESLPLKVPGSDAEVWLIGVDDPHFYQTDDLARAMEPVPLESTKILAAHSPDIYLEATQAGIDLLLCGHTHGGQLCLPGGHAVVNFSTAPRKTLKDRWEHEGMQAYTSRGTGGCQLPLRWNCPAEVTRHTLRCTASK
jgi:predicted MPP superfamily phosphohydrolase